MNKFFNILLVLVLALAVFCLLWPSTTDYKVVGVTDGDTIVVVDGQNNRLKVRLAEIDAPESHQPYGSKSKEILSEKVFGKNVTLVVVQKDRYGRTVAKVYVRGRYINLEMVKEGYAWNYDQYSKNAAMAQAEEDAKKEKLGLWADKDPTPPWKFRRN